MYEEFAIVATIDPIDANNADSATDIIDMSLYHEVLFIILLGVMNDSATFDFALTEDSAANMGTETAISGKALTQVSGNGGDAKQHMISLQASEMTPGKRYVRGTQANSAHSQLAAVVVLGRPRFPPATEGDLSSVTQIID